MGRPIGDTGSQWIELYYFNGLRRAPLDTENDTREMKTGEMEPRPNGVLLKIYQMKMHQTSSSNRAIRHS